MLKSLHIENMAVIRNLEFDFDKGLTVFTGETGAGKSVITDSIKFLICNKISRDLLRTGEKRGTVSAVFSDLSDPVIDKFAQWGFELIDREVTLERTVNSEGRSSCRIEGKGVSQQIMRTVGSILITVHGQNESLRLSDEKERLSLIDTFSKSESALELYREAYDSWKKVKNQITSLIRETSELNRTKDMLEYQSKEIASAKLKPGEEDTLVAERIKLQSTEKIKKHTDAASRTLYSNEKGITASSMALHAAEALIKISDVVPEFSDLSARLRNCTYELDDIASELQRIVAEYDFQSDPSKRLDDIESRLAFIGTLKRKYGASIDEILDYEKKVNSELEVLDTSDDKIAELSDLEKNLLAELKIKARDLTEIRIKGASIIEKEVASTLRFLDMPKVLFTVSVSENEHFDENGKDIIDFYMATNLGEPLKPLSASASGGELSRVMLALKCAVAGADMTDTLIFDEVDTGVSGKTSGKIGIKLKQASKSAQVLTVTHSAQIASLAHHHLLVAKDEINNRHETRLEELDDLGRIEETARILGGINVSESQRLAAIDMITEGKTY